MQQQEARKGSGLDILIAEDNYLLSAELSRFVEQLGHRPIGPAATLAAGLALLDAGSPAPGCAVIDLDLDGEFAFPLARRLQESGVPLVFATGFDRSAVDAGDYQAIYLCKPFACAEFGEALEAALATPRRPVLEGGTGRRAPDDPLTDVIRYSRELRMVTQIIGRRAGATD